MYCEYCGERETCSEVCPRLERHLKHFEVYQRESLFSNEELAVLAERYHTTWADIIPDRPWIWDRIAPLLDQLPEGAIAPFVLHYYEGMRVSEIARLLGLHRVTVYRKLRRARETILREIKAGRW